MKCALFIFLFATIALTQAAPKPNPLSDEFINSLNAIHTTWKAGRNFPEDTPMSSIRKMLGVLPRKPGARKLPLKIHAENVEIPESFDAREIWPDCADIIGEIRDQAACGSCWAFGAVEAMSDRICIHTNASTKVRISAEDLNDCCSDCGHGCDGGWPDEAWLYWAQKGIVTGGLYQKPDQGCKAYSIAPCDHHVEGTLEPCGELVQTPKCQKTCDNGDITYEKDLKFGSAYSIMQSEKQIQIEIMTHGPVEADYLVYNDFLSYKSGVYEHKESTDDNNPGGHAVKIIGWGVETDKKYWLIANSWNAEWGEEGFFKILRGENHCEIEAGIVAGLPKL